MNHKKMLFFLFTIFMFCDFLSQNYNLTNTFNIENSNIPGNFIFDVAEDDNSFIWIATQNGASRFDGKNFFNYTTRNGLPSNDVLQILKDGHGTIWANCFRQVPCYFDEKQNRFVLLKSKNLEKICSGLTFFSFNENGNTFFITHENYFEVDKNKNIRFYSNKEINTDKTKLFLNEKSVATNTESYLTLEKKNFVSLFLKDSKKNWLYKNYIFNISENKIEKFFDFKSNPFKYKKNELTFETSIKWQRFTFNRVFVITADNYFYAYDLDTFALLKKFKISEDINGGILDKNGRFFGGTQDNGLKFFSSGEIKKLEIPENLVNDNFISISKNDKGEIFAGNLSGDILHFDGKSFQKIKLDENSWIRKVLFFGDKTLTISDNCYWIDYKDKNSILLKNNSITAIKRAKKINDSIALLSTISGIYKLNVPKNKYRRMNFPEERVSEIIPIKNEEYYVVSATGLFIYNLKKDNYQKIYENYSFFDGDYDGKLLFLLSSQNNLYVFKNNKLLKIISDDKNFPDNIVKIKFIENRLWIAGKKGVYVLKYHEKNNDFGYEIENFNKNDGLGSNDIYDFAHDEKNVYVASGKGISVIPLNIFAKNFDITTQIISLKINERQRIISDKYVLESDEKNVSIIFSGIETSGHFRNFIYRINGKKWSVFYGNILNLYLENGKNRLEVASVDNNGNVGKIAKQIVFDVKTPFYQSFWFWILMSGLFFGGIFAFYGRWKFIRQKAYYHQKLALENQRNKITADLHDDIGATLSSLQINSAIANKMIEKEKIVDAQKILRKIENQSQKLSENIGDIVWSLKPNKDALMTLSTRIRNSANEILGSTNVSYRIIIDKEIDEEFHDFSERKNLVLITKEALNNIAKYSMAKEVIILFKKNEDNFIFEIKDDGIGFEKDFKLGNGLQNMKKRAEEIGGTFEIFNKDGTEIIIKIPEIRD